MTSSETLGVRSGLLNNAGYQSTAGRQYYSSDQNTQHIIDQNVGIELPFLSGPSPETLFKLSSKPEINPFYIADKCPPSFDTTIESSVSEMFVIAPQHGYKTRGFKEGNLRGISAIEHINGGKGPESYLEVSEKEQSELELDSEFINKEASAFKYGLQEYPPNYGLQLPGPLTTIIKSHTAGKIITSHRRTGYTPSGYSSGWNSAKTNASFMLDPQVS